MKVLHFSDVHKKSNLGDRDEFGQAHPAQFVYAVRTCEINSRVV